MDTEFPGGWHEQHVNLKALFLLIFIIAVCCLEQGLHALHASPAGSIETAIGTTSYSKCTPVPVGEAFETN